MFLPAYNNYGSCGVKNLNRKESVNMSLPFEVSNTKEKGQVVSLCEQGDMGLFGDPLSESDQEKLKKQENANKESN